MWKKDDAAETRPNAPRAETTPPREESPRSRAAPGERATIGRSITIRGEVTGDEDLLIQGKVDGSVDLKQHSVTVGPEGQVKAGISGRVVTVEGEVEGDLRGKEQVILRSTAKVQGDITAPRVVLEDGATFRGGVDMAAAESERSGSSRTSESKASSGSAYSKGGHSSSDTTGSKGSPEASRSESGSRERTEKTTGAAT